MGKSQLIHNNEFHLISKAEIRKATGKLVESLNLAAGSTDGFDIYKVVDAYFTVSAKVANITVNRNR